MAVNKSEKEIAIVGMGFCGLMTAIHLIRNADSKIKLHLINHEYPFAKGIAYSTQLTNHLLNVPAGNMSAFSSSPHHFLDWIFQKEPFCSIDKDILAKMYLPRKEYGNYLLEIWSDVLKNKNPLVSLNSIASKATDIETTGKKYRVHIESSKWVEADDVVLATGNDTPGNPKIRNDFFFESKNYFQSPWNLNAAKKINPSENILIIGNGLTMVDTVLELIENGCRGKIYSVSPNGFNILPHRHNGMVYTKLVSELKKPYEINSLFRLFRKHVAFVRQFGLSAEPVIDSVREFSQQIWLELSTIDKKRFLVHLRHLWGVARHRLPAHIYDLIQELKTENKLIILKGKLIDITESRHEIIVSFFNMKKNIEESLTVSRVINCTGPLPDISKSQNTLLKNLVMKGIIQPDVLRLGIETNLQGAIVSTDNSVSTTIFTLGNNLRGLLWETTAVPELRVQAENLALLLLKKIEGEDAYKNISTIRKDIHI